jgi:predicted nucleic acid-binding protein
LESAELSGRRPLVIDANVLIDYLIVEPKVLALARGLFGKVVVPVPVCEEVELLTDSLCQELGLEQVLPSTAQLLEAAKTASRSPLSFTDCLCHLVAQEGGCICVTNDKRLRKVCERDGVPLLRGLELMLELFGAGHLSLSDAESIAWRIHQENMFIKQETVLRFCARLRERGA